MIVSDLTQRFLLTKHLPWCATLSASSRALVAAAPSLQPHNDRSGHGLAPASEAFAVNSVLLFKIDIAGNVLKRSSASRFQFVRFGGSQTAPGPANPLCNRLLHNCPFFASRLHDRLGRSVNGHIVARSRRNGAF
jgi:predicted transcriptional regulator DUF2083